MIFNAKSEPAVSPVIGTILLVAIAVVLVAIILVVVMGFSGDTNEKKVGLNAQPESGANATLILYGGASIDELVKLEMIDQGSANGSYVTFWDINDDGDAFVGLPYLAKDVARPLESMAIYDTRINVRGTFSDGTEVILLVQPMTFYDVWGTGTSTLTPEPKLSDYFTSFRLMNGGNAVAPTVVDLLIAESGSAVYLPSGFISSATSSLTVGLHYQSFAGSDGRSVKSVTLVTPKQTWSYANKGGYATTQRNIGNGPTWPLTLTVTFNDDTTLVYTWTVQYQD